ncbi:unnamed protein product [Mycena citricolor]|uniref:Uncharacterized protein n=2 Tax=Mycena citricolor TaxID=2018698 RepID=A0AAD2H0G7_9AGAR|nr:unnamed protein product [Mycena citricolor]
MGGRLMAFRAKYGTTRNAAIGRCRTEPSSSQRMYAPPRFREMTTRGPRTRSPRLKSKSRIVDACSCSKRAAARSLAPYTSEWSWDRWDRRFCRAIAWRAMSSVVERTDSGGGSNEVWRASHPSSDGDTVCPEDRVCGAMPLRLVSIGGFEERLSDIKMRSLSKVGLGIVPGYPDVLDPVLFLELQRAPSAEQVFEDPQCQRLGIFTAEHTEFGVVGE